MTARLIALTSPAMGSGKSTVANHLVTRHHFTRVAFATPLKMMTEGLFQGIGMPTTEINARVYGDRKEEVIHELGISSRRVQQLIGTEFGRRLIRDTIWVDLTMAQVEHLLAAGRSVVIDDLRFPNELEAIEQRGGEAYRVVRPGAVVTQVHASEGQLDGIHLPEIWNTADLDALFSATDRAVFA